MRNHAISLATGGKPLERNMFLIEVVCEHEVSFLGTNSSFGDSFAGSFRLIQQFKRGKTLGFTEASAFLSLSRKQ